MKQARSGKGPRVFSDDRKMKRCNCEIHNGALVPIEHFTLIQRGPRKGKLMSRCKIGVQAWNHRVGWVEYKRVKFIFNELQFRIGKTETVRLLGMSANFWSRHNGNSKENNRWIRKATVTRAIVLLRELREKEIARHKLSIRRGAAARGEQERKPTTSAHFNGPDDKDASRVRNRRRGLTTA